MTLHEVEQHIKAVNIGNWFEREKKPAGWLRTTLKHNFCEEGATRWIFEAALPDGWWYISVSKFDNGEYGYFIPETREQEDKLKHQLYGWAK